MFVFYHCMHDMYAMGCVPAFCVKGTNVEQGDGQFHCSFMPAPEVLTKPDRRPCKRGKPAHGVAY